MLPLESTLHPSPTLSLQTPWWSVGGGPGPCPFAVEMLSGAVASHSSPPDIIAKEEKGSPAFPPGTEPRRHSQPLLPRAGRERDLPLYHPRTAQDSSLSAHQPLDFCSQSSTHRSVGHQPGQSPHPVPGADGSRLPGPSAGWWRTGCSRLRGPEKRRAGGGGQGRWAHLPNSVQLKTQSSRRIDTAAAVSLSFE